MSLPFYDLRYFTSDGVFLQSLNIFEELEYGRRKNDIGAASLLMPLNQYDINIFQPGFFLEIWRFDEFSNSYNLVDKTIWVLAAIIFETKDDGTETIELTFYDSIYLLTYRVNPYFALDEAIYPLVEYPSIFTDQPLDDVAKYYVFHNFTTAASNPLLNTQAPVTVVIPLPLSVTPGLRVTPLLIDPYLNDAPSATYAGSWNNVLEALQDIAKLSESLGTSLWFDIEYLPADSFFTGSFIFKTWTVLRGSDVTQNIELSVENGGFSSAKLEIDYTDAANIVYAIGIEDPVVADGIDNIFNVSAFDNLVLPPFGLKEYVLDLSGDSNVSNKLNLLEVKARTELQSRQGVFKLTGDVVQQGNLAFFKEYLYADRIAVKYKGYTFESEIEKYTVTVNADGEKIRIPIESSKIINNVTIQS